jgi:hypothetical protein
VTLPSVSSSTHMIRLRRKPAVFPGNSCMKQPICNPPHIWDAILEVTYLNLTIARLLKLDVIFSVWTG